MSKIAKCDKCKREEPIPIGLSVAKGWSPITITVSGYRSRYFDICPNCAAKVGFEPQSDANNLGDKILDIFYEIAEEVASNE